MIFFVMFNIVFKLFDSVFVSDGFDMFCFEVVICEMLCVIGEDFECEGLFDMFVCVVCFYCEFFVGFE